MFWCYIYDIGVNPKILTLTLFFYFFFLIFFYFTRFYLNAKSFIVITLVILLSILYQYYVLYKYIFERSMSINLNLTNFTVGDGVIDINLSFSLNTLSYLFSLLVIIIALFTNLYSLNYFKNEADEMGFLF